MDFDWRLILIVVGAFAILKLFETRCPECRHFLALRKTGAQKKAIDAVTTRWKQFKCDHCGHEKWRANNPN